LAYIPLCRRQILASVAGELLVVQAQQEQHAAVGTKAELLQQPVGLIGPTGLQEHLSQQHLAVVLPGSKA
jgi:hypothetical protein